MDLKMRKERIISWVNKLEDARTLELLENLAEEGGNEERTVFLPESGAQEVYQLSEKELALLKEASDAVKAGDYLTNEEVNHRVKEWLYK